MAKPSNSSEREVPLSAIFILTITGAENFVGIIVNGFIMTVNLTVWVQRKGVSTSGKILLFLSASRIALQSVMMLEIMSIYTFVNSYFKHVLYYIYQVCFMFLNCCGLWFAAVLSFFYFVKIANFPYPLFLKLKWRISRLIPWFLRLSVFISFISSMFFYKSIYSMRCFFTFNHFNYTKINMVKVTVFFNLGIFIPLTIFIVTATLLILSLKRHILLMRNSSTGSKDSSMEAHMRAIKAISYFLILYIFNAVALFLYVSCIFSITSFWIVLLRIIIAAYPVGHSILLIQDNPGLQRAWKQLQTQIHFYQKEQTVR